MNLVETTVDGGTVGLAGSSIPVDRGRAGGPVILGVRPEAFEDASFAPPGRPEIEVRVEVIEELGSDAYVFFEVDAKPVVVDEAVAAEDAEASLLADRSRSLFAARVDPRTEGSRR